MILIYTDCKNIIEAKKIAAMLLKLKLIACANYWPIESQYLWKGKIVKSKEAALILKTRNDYYKRIESIIKKIHSYETPSIMKLSVDKVQSEYLGWLLKETKII